MPHIPDSPGADDLAAADMNRKNRIAQWAFDTRAVLGRFHIWLDDVEERWVKGHPDRDFSFVGGSLERAVIVTTAVTALGTRLWGRWGEGQGADKAGLNRVKKDADAISAYAMSEGLWYLTRSLPENHAIMVSLGEGLMPKAGETPEMGSNPLLGFGRVYARPQVARFVDGLVNRLVNQPGYRWSHFWDDLQKAGVTVWGAAVDTLENTSRFAKGSATGPMAVLHLFDQPLKVARPYEGYVGNLVLPAEVVRLAADRSLLVDFLTPRRLVMEAIQAVYPGIAPGNVHIWTLGGPSRAHRIGALWQAWRELGAHLVEDGWEVPGTGIGAFTESGTYAPMHLVGPYTGADGARHLFICDGYAASAEAIQAASIDQVLQLQTSLCLFSSHFDVPYDREPQLMLLDPDAAGFDQHMADIVGHEVEPAVAAAYRADIRAAAAAELPVGRRTLTVDDFIPKKEWRVLAVSSSMLPDPYSGAAGIEQVGPRSYRVTSRASTKKGVVEVALTFRLGEDEPQMRMVFSPLLDRFYAGQDFRTRPVKISDSGRIRNELQTLCPEHIEHLDDDRLRVHLDRVDDAVLPPDKKALIRAVLEWYKANHPVWFHWLEVG